MNEWLSNNLGNLFSAAGQAGSIYGAIDSANSVESMGNTMYNDLKTLGETSNTGSQFNGYGVTSTLGNTTVGSDGSVNMGVGVDGSVNQNYQNMMGTGYGGASDGLNRLGAQNAANPWMIQGAQQMAYANKGMDDQMAANYGAANQFRDQSMQDMGQRTQDIYNQAMAVQQPGLDRAQAAQQAREYAMGRGGVRGSQFGGTAEDAAMARARAEAGNQASFAAIQQAQAEQLQQANLAQAYGQSGLQGAEMRNNSANMLSDLGVKQKQMTDQRYTNMGQLGNQMAQIGLDANKLQYLPMQMQMELMQLAGADADRSQTGQLTGLGYLTQMMLGGSEVNVNASNVANQTRANLYDSILDNMGGSQNGEGGASGIAGLLESIVNKGG
jgi:hypothetical protein